MNYHRESGMMTWTSGQKHLSLVDVTVYLLFSPSPFTQEKVKNYKSLECYQSWLGERNFGLGCW